MFPLLKSFTKTFKFVLLEELSVIFSVLSKTTLVPSADKSPDVPYPSKRVPSISSLIRIIVLFNLSARKKSFSTGS